MDLDQYVVRLTIVLIALTSCYGQQHTTPSSKADKHILHLEETVAQLQSQFQAQEQKQAAVLSSLLSRLSSTTDELLNVKSGLNYTQEELNTALKEISSLKTELKDLNLTSQEHQEGKAGNPNIAFSSSITKDEILNPGQIVRYTYVLVNNGNSYNNTTGIFTCPENGTYMFQIHAQTPGDTRTFKLQLIQNDVMIASIMGHDEHALMSSGNTAVLNLRKGDQVCVKSDGKSSVRSLYTTFSGYFIASDNTLCQS